MLPVPVGGCAVVRPQHQQVGLHVGVHAGVDDPNRGGHVLVGVLLGESDQALMDLLLDDVGHTEVHLDSHDLQVHVQATHVADLLWDERRVRNDGADHAGGVEHGVHQADLHHLVGLPLDLHPVANVVGVLHEEEQHGLEQVADGVAKDEGQRQHRSGEGGEASEDVDAPDEQVEGQEEKVQPRCQTPLQALHHGVGVAQGCGDVAAVLVNGHDRVHHLLHRHLGLAVHRKEAEGRPGILLALRSVGEELLHIMVCDERPVGGLAADGEKEDLAECLGVLQLLRLLLLGAELVLPHHGGACFDDHGGAQPVHLLLSHVLQVPLVRKHLQVDALQDALTDRHLNIVARIRKCAGLHGARCGA
mmetsp:Transcript_24749/g.63397  ORF Transcript_24749/g.63397 Transcript_24749/m.63397 type:complete len:361 (+) Transcript_24749:187-1269(+)